MTQKEQLSLSLVQHSTSLSEGKVLIKKKLLREHYGNNVKELVRKFSQGPLAATFAPFGCLFQYTVWKILREVGILKKRTFM